MTIKTGPNGHVLLVFDDCEYELVNVPNKYYLTFCCNMFLKRLEPKDLLSREFTVEESPGKLRVIDKELIFVNRHCRYVKRKTYFCEMWLNENYRIFVGYVWFELYEENFTERIVVEEKKLTFMRSQYFYAPLFKILFVAGKVADILKCDQNLVAEFYLNFLRYNFLQPSVRDVVFRIHRTSKRVWLLDNRKIREHFVDKNSQLRIPDCEDSCEEKVSVDFMLDLLSFLVKFYRTAIR